MQAKVVLVAGRAIENYRECKAEVPADYVTGLCVVCKQAVAVSPGGAANASQAQAAGHVSGLICTRCVVLHGGEVAGIIATENGEKVLRTNPDAQAFFDLMKSRVRP